IAQYVGERCPPFEAPDGVGQSIAVGSIHGRHGGAGAVRLSTGSRTQNLRMRRSRCRIRLMEENELPEDVDGCFEGEEDEYEDECDDGEPPDDYEFEIDFADPGGRSALRAATPTNPRNLPCPTCH